MENHICIHETDWGKLWEKIDNIEHKVCQHVIEGEKEGGWRDRLLVAEKEINNILNDKLFDIRKEISVIKQGYWKIGLACGFMGALIGELTPELWQIFLKIAGLVK